MTDLRNTGPMEDCTKWSHQHHHRVLKSDIPLLTVLPDGEYAPSRILPEDEMVTRKTNSSTIKKRKRS